MHNLHLVVVRGESHEDAINSVEIEIGEWGDENNWRHFGGSVCEDGTCHINDKDSRYTPESCDAITIDSINKMVENWMKGEEDSDTILKVAKLISTGKESKVENHDWLTLKHYCDHKFSVNNRTTFDVLKNEFRSMEYDEFGVTQMDGLGNDDDKQYIVFIDMHS